MTFCRADSFQPLPVYVASINSTVKCILQLADCDAGTAANIQCRVEINWLGKNFQQLLVPPLDPEMVCGIGFNPAIAHIIAFGAAYVGDIFQS